MSRREGWAGVWLATAQAACLAVLFQAQNMAWGGLVLWGTLSLYLGGVLGLTALLGRVRGVHPRHHHRALGLAGAWALTLTTVGGWSWVAQGPHATSVTATTMAAVVALLPLLLVASRLVRGGR